MKRKRILASMLSAALLFSLSGALGGLTATAAEDGLIVRYKFDGNTNDTSGNAMGGTLLGTGSAFVSDPIFGTALNLTGGSAYVQLPGQALDATKTTSITVSGWLLSNTFGDWQRMFDFGKSSTTGYFFYAPHNATPVAKITATTNAAEQGITNGRRWSLDGKWHHAVVVLDYAAQTMSLYKDGVLDRAATGVTLTMNDLLSATASANMLYIGKAQFPDPYLNARVADFRVYSKALAAADVTTLYNAVMTAENMAKADAANLTIAGDLNNVISNLTLPAAGTPYASAITWSSSNPAVVSAAGVVTRPPATGSDATVTLTATLPGSVTKQFNVTVLKALTDSQAVLADKTALDLGDTSRVTSNLTLPTAGAQGSVISWASSHPAVISATGAVTTPSSGSVTVTLTATITKGAASDTKTFTATVFPLRPIGDGVNISVAPQATPVASFTASPSVVTTVNDGRTASGSSAANCWETWSSSGSTVNIYYEWPQPVVPTSMDVIWWYDQAFGSTSGGVQLPVSCAVQYWTGSAWADVANMADAAGRLVSSVGTQGNGTTGNNTLFNGVSFDPVQTTRLRLMITQNKAAASATGIGIGEWRVFSNDADSIAFSGVAFVEPQWTTKDLSLPALSGGGYQLAWSSSDPAVIGHDGHVTRGAAARDVIMTATATKDGDVRTKTFAFTVLPLGQSPRTIDVDLDNLGIEISPTLYGAFFEDIDHALDGGINADLVDNGSFQQYNWPTSLPSSVSNRGPNSDRYSLSATEVYSWRANIKGGAAGTATIVSTAPMNANNTYNLEVNITNAGSGDGHGYGIAANGYSTASATNVAAASMPINAGVSYNLGLYLRGDYAGQVLVFLENASGVLNSNVLAFRANATEWKKNTGVLTGLRSDNSRLVVLGDELGKFYLDNVTLVPEASQLWRGGAAGNFRNDLVSAIADLNPKFLRFPGGCASEGKSQDRLYRWKDTVGPVEERRQLPNYWGYWSSNGIGYYEYFCLAEQLGATPLPVIGLGLSCPFWQGTNYYVAPIGTPEQLQAYTDLYVQDALDLIEFCNGDVNTTWGAKRAAMGHPKPFNLTYLGVGNENWGADFWARFDIVYNAVRAAYPDIEIISTSGPYASGTDFNNNYRQIDSKYQNTIVDEHYYQDAQWFLNNINRYNPTSTRGNQGLTYNRARPTRVFVGEYADSGNSNNYRSALYEAAFTTALEKNSDMVLMASYAPLFCRKTTPTNWGANLIWFDNRGLWRTNNYYYQKLFANNRGDRAAAFDVNTYGGGTDSSLYVSPTVDSGTGDTFVKIVNIDPRAKEIRVNLNGADDTYRATLEYITSADLNARNQTATTYTEAVKPVSVDLGLVTDGVTIDVPMYAVCVLRLEKILVIDATFAEDGSKVAVSIRNKGLRDVNVSVILAWYDADGALGDLNITPATSVPDSSMTVDCALPAPHTGGTYKAFVWEAQTFVPLTAPFLYE